jgi:hypothetical protein
MSKFCKERRAFVQSVIVSSPFGAQGKIIITGHLRVCLCGTPSLTRGRVRKHQNYVMTDGQSTSLSWCQAPIWVPRPDFYYGQAAAVLFMWDAVFDERTGLLFRTAADPLQRLWARGSLT